jgi:predicted dehydrogenase
MRFLIAGLGSVGRRHLRNLVALGEKDVVLYRTRLSTLPEEELAGFPVETDLATALGRRPDGAIIANPTALHLDVAIPAAEAGCHILMEKPISHSLDRVAELQAALRRGGGRFLTAFQYRFHPTLRRAAALLAAGEIGRPLSVRSHWGEYLPNWHPWEDHRNSYAARPDLGGGVVLTLCHPFDYLGWLLGPYEVVWARTASTGELGIPVEDVADAGLNFASGAAGTIHLDYVQRPPAHTLEVIGSRGTLRWENATGTLSVYRAQQSDWEHIPPPPGFERNDMFLDEIKHFLAVARGEASPLCPLDDGIRALEIALQVQSQGRKP